MALPKILHVLVWFGFTPCFLWAHADPRGDTHPVVEVVGGNFSVTFQTDSGHMDFYPVYPRARIIFAPDGKEVVPRHRLEPRPSTPLDRQPGPTRDLTPKVETATTGDLSRFVLNTPNASGAPQQQPLALEPQKWPIVVESTITSSAIGFIWTRMADTLPPPLGTPALELHLAHVDATGGKPGSTVLLGQAADQWGTSASAPVWAGGRWWVAWVREALTAEERKNPLKRWQTVLSTYEPAKRELKHQTLEEISTWNTEMQLKTTGDWLCAAWHASVDGSYPGVAKICTAFVKVPTD